MMSITTAMPGKTHPAVENWIVVDEFIFIVSQRPIFVPTNAGKRTTNTFKKRPNTKAITP